MAINFRKVREGMDPERQARIRTRTGEMLEELRTQEPRRGEGGFDKDQLRFKPRDILGRE